MWPEPHSFTNADGTISFGYDKEAVLVSLLHVPTDAPVGTVEIAASTSWTAWNGTFYTGTNLHRVSLTVGDYPTIDPLGWKVVKPAIGKRIQLLPKTRVSARRKSGSVELTLTTGESNAELQFFPFESLLKHSQLVFEKQGTQSQLRIPLSNFRGPLTRIKGLIVASHPGVWEVPDTAVEVDLPINRE